MGGGGDGGECKLDLGGEGGGGGLDLVDGEDLEVGGLGA